MNEANILSSKSIIGDKVRNPEGEDLGEIKELLMDPENGKVEYGVLSFGGFLGVGNKMIAVPFEALILQNEGHFLLNVDKETLDKTSSQIDYQGRLYYIY